MVDRIEQRLRVLGERRLRRFSAVCDANASRYAPVVPRSRRSRISLVMIVRNEEQNLPDCLASAVGLMDDTIVIDTGSTDATKEVAKRYGAQVFEFPWINDFAAARNECLRYSTGDWNIWLDADDRLDSENRQRLSALFAELGPGKDAYAMKIRSQMDRQGTAVRLLDQVRVFPNHPQVRWEYRIHEQILPAVRRFGGSIRWTDIVIDHTGYQDANVRRTKLERNLRLLQLDDGERGDDPFTMFNLGWTLLDLGQTAEAVRLLRRSLERSAPDSSIVRKLYCLLTQAHRRIGQPAEALALCREGQRRCPDDVELPFEEAQLHRETGDLIAAEAALARLLTMKPGEYFASVDPALRGYRARQALAEIYRAQGRLREAEEQWRLVVQQRAEFVPAWLCLADLWIVQRRGDEVERAASALARIPAAQLEAAVLRGRLCLMRREFAAARHILEGAINQAPQAIGPRIALSHVLLQEARDWDAAEKALRSILTLCPDHAEARHNLAILFKQQGRDGVPL